MATRNAVGPAGSDEHDPNEIDLAFLAVSGLYAGFLLAGLLTTAIALRAVARTTLASTYGIGFISGCIGGIVLAHVDHRLPARLGRTITHRLGLIIPAALFGFLWLVPLEAPIDVVALPSAITMVATGYVLSQLAGNRYVDAVTPGDPEATWRWDPPGSVVIDVLLAVMWAALATSNAIGGNWLEALLWLTIAVCWIGSCLAEGRWTVGPWRNRCEIQCYDTGFVKRRPYTKTFVPWHEITHIRFRDGELVLDRGLRDVRFDRDELEDPEAVLETIDRYLETATAR